jgi:hypothetical protein
MVGIISEKLDGERRYLLARNCLNPRWWAVPTLQFCYYNGALRYRGNTPYNQSPLLGGVPARAGWVDPRSPHTKQNLTSPAPE